MRTLFICAALLSWLSSSAQTVIRVSGNRQDTLSLKSYINGAKRPDTLSQLIIVSGTDTMYFFNSVKSRVVAQPTGKSVRLTEIFAIPLSGADDYVLVPLRDLTILPSGLMESSGDVKMRIGSLLADRNAVLNEYQALRRDVDARVPIDEYDEALVKRTAVLLWQLTLFTLSGDEEFYAILTNIEELLPSARVGEAGYAWMDCQYLLGSEKADGF